MLNQISKTGSLQWRISRLYAFSAYHLDIELPSATKFYT